MVAKGMCIGQQDVDQYKFRMDTVNQLYVHCLFRRGEGQVPGLAIQDVVPWGRLEPD